MENLLNSGQWRPVLRSGTDPDENLDPYGNAPPPKPKPRTPAGSGDGTGATPPPGPPGGRGVPALALIAAGAVALLLAVGLLLAWALWPENTESDWHQPLARIGEPPPPEAALAERIFLDAAPSVAAPGRTLTYHWDVIAPEDADVLFQDEGSPRIFRRTRYSTRSPLVTIQFFTPGEALLELQVHDGRAYSEPVRVGFDVLGAPSSS